MPEKPSEDLTIQILIELREEVRSMRASFDERFERLERAGERVEVRLGALEARMKATGTQFELLDRSVKKFTGIANEALVHFGEEFDRARDRLDVVEDKLGIAPPVD